MLTQIPGLESRCLRAIGSDRDEAGPTAQDLASARAALADLLPAEGPAPQWNDHSPTPVDHVFLAALMTNQRNDFDSVLNCIWTSQIKPALA